MESKPIRSLTRSKSNPSFPGLVSLPMREPVSRRSFEHPKSLFRSVDPPKEFGPEKIRSILLRSGRTTLTATRPNDDFEDRLIYSSDGVRLNRVLRQGGVFNYNLLFEGNSAFFKYGESLGSREIYERFLKLARLEMIHILGSPN